MFGSILIIIICLTKVNANFVRRLVGSVHLQPGVILAIPVSYEKVHSRMISTQKSDEESLGEFPNIPYISTTIQYHPVILIKATSVYQPLY